MIYPTLIFMLNTIGVRTAPGSVIETWNKAIDYYHNKNKDEGILK